MKIKKKQLVKLIDEQREMSDFGQDYSSSGLMTSDDSTVDEEFLMRFKQLIIKKDIPPQEKRNLSNVVLTLVHYAEEDKFDSRKYKLLSNFIEKLYNR